MKLEEIKNAEKQLKIVEREAAFLDKKQARLHDSEHLRSLEGNIAENKRRMEEL